MDSNLYYPLPVSTSVSSKTTRNLRIKPGAISAAIQCDLEVIDLHNEPPYEALSYIWGELTLAQTIRCNGRNKSVTPNLRAALQRLRLLEEERLIWVDAICINQDDPDERSHQVLLMKQIYAQALQVIVWLGNDNGQGQLAIKMIKKAAYHAYMSANRLFLDIDFEGIVDLGGQQDEVNYISQQRHSSSSLLQKFYFRTDRRWKSLFWFYMNPWFSRIWVVQEVAFSPTLTYLGENDIEWSIVGFAAR